MDHISNSDVCEAYEERIAELERELATLRIVLTSTEEALNAQLRSARGLVKALKKIALEDALEAQYIAKDALEEYRKMKD